MVGFDRNGRWHDERGRFARPPPEVPVPPSWMVTWTFSVRGFDEIWESPPREDVATSTFRGLSPGFASLMSELDTIDQGYRQQRIYIFNVDSPDIRKVSG